MKNAYLFAAALPLIAVTACGGSGGSTAFIPAPSPTPTPTPTPTPAPAAGPAIPAAVQTAAPALPVAGSVKFSTLAQATDFPLLMTAAKGGPGDGDQAITSAGGILRANPDGTYRLTLNSATAGVTNATIPSQVGGSVFFVNASVDSADLDYTRFGYWSHGDIVDGVFNLGAWSTGFVTPANQIPTEGTASYSGKATGLYNAAVTSMSPADFDSTIKGDVNLTADFGQSSLSGSITNITATSLYTALTGPVNNIGFSATIDRSNNLFSGSTSATSFPGGVYAFGPTASGLVNGRFYGPGAAEVGAVFNLTEGTRRLIGSFGAKH